MSTSVMHNIDARAGDTIKRRITVTNDGSPLDLTTYSIRSTFLFGAPLALTEGSGITVVDAVNGVFDLLITDEQSAKTAGSYSYGVKIENASGEEYTIVYGTLTLTTELVE